MSNKKEFTLATINLFRFTNAKEGTEEKVESLVNYVSLFNQLETITRDFPIEEFESAHPGKDFWVATKEDFNGLIPSEDWEDFEEERKNALSVKDAINDLPYGKDTYNSLSITDRVNIIVEAHKNKCAKGVVIGKADLEGINLKSAVIDYYENAINKGTKDGIRSAIFKLLGTEGELFYGVRFTRSDFDTKSIMNFLATFGGKADRKENKKKGTISNYDYHLKTSWKVQSSAITTFLGVMLEARKDSYSVENPNASKGE